MSDTEHIVRSERVTIWVPILKSHRTMTCTPQMAVALDYLAGLCGGSIPVERCRGYTFAQYRATRSIIDSHTTFLCSRPSGAANCIANMIHTIHPDSLADRRTLLDTVENILNSEV